MFRNLSFARQILPIAALIGVAIGAWLIFVGLPDRSTSEPVEQPPKPSASWPTSRAWRAPGLSSRRAR